jgi:catechol 2,3-dioxygenase-like lactoylglutathione lyase family enzyme
MTTAAEHLNYVAPVFRVSDLARTVAFYRDRLGFGVEFEYEGFYAGLCREGCHVHLNCSAPLPRDQAAFEAAEHIDTCFSVRNAAALAAQFESRGVAFSVTLRRMPYGTEFYVRDPDNYILGFVEPAA